MKPNEPVTACAIHPCSLCSPESPANFGVLDLRELTKGECMSLPGPCPNRTCRYHVNSSKPRAGVVPHGDDEPCTLRLAAQGSRSLAVIGDMLGVTRERIRQIEAKSMKRFKRKMQITGLEQEVIECLREVEHGR